MRIFRLPLIPYVSVDFVARGDIWEVIFQFQPFVWALVWVSNRTHTECWCGPFGLTAFWHDKEMEEQDHAETMAAIAERDRAANDEGSGV